MPEGRNDPVPRDGDNPLAALADLLTAVAGLVPESQLPGGPPVALGRTTTTPRGQRIAGGFMTPVDPVNTRDVVGAFVPQTGADVALEFAGGPAAKGAGFALGKLAAILPAVVRANAATPLGDLSSKVMRDVYGARGTPADYTDTLAEILRTQHARTPTEELEAAVGPAVVEAADLPFRPRPLDAPTGATPTQLPQWSAQNIAEAAAEQAQPPLARFDTLYAWDPSRRQWEAFEPEQAGYLRGHNYTFVTGNRAIGPPEGPPTSTTGSASAGQQIDRLARDQRRARGGPGFEVHQAERMRPLVDALVADPDLRNPHVAVDLLESIADNAQDARDIIHRLPRGTRAERLVADRISLMHAARQSLSGVTGRSFTPGLQRLLGVTGHHLPENLADRLLVDMGRNAGTTPESNDRWINGVIAATGMDLGNLRNILGGALAALTGDTRAPSNYARVSDRVWDRETINYAERVPALEPRPSPDAVAAEAIGEAPEPPERRRR